MIYSPFSLGVIVFLIEGFSTEVETMVEGWEKL